MPALDFLTALQAAVLARLTGDRTFQGIPIVAESFADLEATARRRSASATAFQIVVGLPSIVLYNPGIPDETVALTVTLTEPAWPMPRYNAHGEVGEQVAQRLLLWTPPDLDLTFPLVPDAESPRSFSREASGRLIVQRLRFQTFRNLVTAS